ncbi:E3 ubiquitin/ISG15 ligase TRIM25 isoform X2 [Sphaerodactylus townsendi]|uniref:E3 ubiquitin/ISG15 ligase TRIM25 isoform X2 n=1 Tax=Sphaerodactylus townsendi TaxID=933632 RepID=UPI002026A25B|nr:E3 ubiquitin/ISG15 ligase TRIM25 isoform X2 [Sphaerodactylus townsendi]
MAEISRAASSSNLAGLEEELTCSICLCLFERPVTTPCGHNFCSPCLEMIWGDGAETFRCPQCRSAFDSRPELKPNTVLCRVVEQLQGTQGGDPSAEEQTGWGPSKPPRVACDSCPQHAEAAKTCLTCMASFCQEHLKPHLDSPAFQGHQLCSPMKDLQQRKCQAHNKLMEFYCKEHAACICCICLVKHKMCTAAPLQEAKGTKESQLKNRLTELYSLNEKASQSLDQVRVQQKQISETAARKMELLRAEFQEMIALMKEEEKTAMSKIVAEEKRVQDKFDYVYTILGRKQKEIQGERDRIEIILTEDDDIAFLKNVAKLRQSSIKDVFIPRIDLDQNLIHTVYQKTFGIKETVKQLLAFPLEMKAEGNIPWKPKPIISSIQPGKQVPAQPAKKNPVSKQRRRPAKRAQSPSQRTRSSSRPEPGTPSGSLETFLTKSREELLEFATRFTLDYNSAHNKVILTEQNTKISVSDKPRNYPPHRQRFMYCSQVQSFQCFKRGIHYWEVELEQSNFCGVGVCYGSMAKDGSESRLGRNSSSWCIEWFNAQVSAWHNDIEKRLPNTKVKKIGVLLNYEGGFVIFFGVSQKLSLLYKFKAQFTEALYPAFWVFSSGTTISLCQLN